MKKSDMNTKLLYSIVCNNQNAVNVFISSEINWNSFDVTQNRLYIQLHGPTIGNFVAERVPSGPMTSAPMALPHFLTSSITAVCCNFLISVDYWMPSIINGRRELWQGQWNICWMTTLPIVWQCRSHPYSWFCKFVGIWHIKIKIDWLIDR
jgi:hypothetical protein